MLAIYFLIQNLKTNKQTTKNKMVNLMLCEIHLNLKIKGCIPVVRRKDFEGQCQGSLYDLLQASVNCSSKFSCYQHDQWKWCTTKGNVTNDP